MPKRERSGRQQTGACGSAYERKRIQTYLDTSRIRSRINHESMR
jgi:hypothetical protein